MAGSSGSLFVMGALADYLNFGFWFGSGTFQNSDWKSSGSGGGLRVEAFPFVRLFPHLSGLGVLGEFGIGAAKLTSNTPGVPEASGTQSYLGSGVFYEWSFGSLFGGHFAVGLCSSSTTPSGLSRSNGTASWPALASSFTGAPEDPNRGPFRTRGP